MIMKKLSKHTIIPIEDLMSSQYNDEEIDFVISHLCKSLVYAMLIDVGVDVTSEKHLMSIVKRRGWMDAYTWPESKYNSFHKKLEKVFYNIYRFGPVKSRNSADMWMMKYGAKIQ